MVDRAGASLVGLCSGAEPLSAGTAPSSVVAAGAVLVAVAPCTLRPGHASPALAAAFRRRYHGSVWSRLRRTAGCLAQVLIFGVLVLGLCVAAGRSCCHTTWTDVPAPSGSLVAVVKRDYCDLGATGSSVLLTVTLRGPQDWFGRAERISLVAMQRSGSTATAYWEDDATLVVEYRPSGRVGDTYALYHVGPDEWNGVRIVYRDLRAG